MRRLGIMVTVAVLLGGVAVAARADAPECRNSFDPACGPFFWDPPPQPNDRGTATVTFTPEFPKPGETVTFTVTIDDPDSGQGGAVTTKKVFGDEQTPPTMVHCDPAFVFGYGPWDTPPEQPFREEITFQHAYAGVGDYRAEFAFDLCGSGPYREFYEVTTTVPVRQLPYGQMICVRLHAVGVNRCV